MTYSKRPRKYCCLAWKETPATDADQRPEWDTNQNEKRDEQQQLAELVGIHSRLTGRSEQ